MRSMSRFALTLILTLGAAAAPNSIVVPKGAETLTVGILGAHTAHYTEKFCLKKNCSAFISVGDSLYDSGVDFTSEGIQRFYKGWADMYVGEAFDNKTWYQAFGNHDIVAGQAGVDFQTRLAPLIDDRWYFGHEHLPYYTYDLTGSNWTATFGVVDFDCFIDNYQKDTSIYNTDYVIACHKDTQKQVDFLRESFAQSDATWKILQIHHGYISSSSNYTELAPLMEIVRENNGVVVNGHDHCMAHYQYEDTDFVLTGGAGYAEAGDCNYGVPIGAYAKWLGADANQAANGFVTLDINYNALKFGYYARDMRLNGADYYPVKDDMKPSYSFAVTEHATKA